MTQLNVHQRLAKVMEEVTYIQKEHKKGMQYSTVSHDAVTAKVRPALLKNGIVYYPVRCEHTHNGNRAECEMTIRFVNIDEPNDFFDVPTFGYGVDNQDKGPGKAMSYAVKYALLKALGLETGDDPDNESIDHSRDDPNAHKALSDNLMKAVNGAESQVMLANILNNPRFKADLERLRGMNEEAAAHIEARAEQRTRDMKEAA